MTTLPRILIVDSSRVVRATLSKHLAGHFEITEESNGESAWQTLVLDSGIVAVISGVQTQKLGGHGLVERLRENRLERLKSMPFFLIVSDTESEEGKEKSRALGVSDFLTKVMKRDEILQRVEALIKAPDADEPTGEEASQGTAPPAGRRGNTGEKPRLLSRPEIEEQLSQALDFPDDRAEPLSVLVLEVGNYGALAAQFGQDVADKICGRFSQLLLGTIRGCDSIGLHQTERCVIVSQGVTFSQCTAFAERLKAGVASAQISVAGQPVKLVVEAGVASVPEDGTLPANDLLALALKRLKTCPGASPRKSPVAKKAWLDIEIPALRTLASLLGNSPEEVEPHLGTLGVEVLPLLKAIDREFGFGLPLPEMERRLKDRAKTETA